MKRLILIGLTGVLLSTPVHAKDILIVVLRNNGEKTVHQQVVPHESCARLLNEVRKGSTVTLTLKDPAAEGIVVEVQCVRPDGSIEIGTL
jgi:hypothetical protein